MVALFAAYYALALTLSVIYAINPEDPPYYAVDAMQFAGLSAVLGLFVAARHEEHDYFFDKVSIVCVLLFGGVARPLISAAPRRTFYFYVENAAFLGMTIWAGAKLRSCGRLSIADRKSWVTALALGVLTTVALFTTLFLIGSALAVVAPSARFPEKSLLTFAAESGEVPVATVHRKEATLLGYRPWQLLGVFVVSMGTAAVIEEPIFRGFVLGYLVNRRRWRASAAVLMQAFLFWILHIDTPGFRYAFWISVPLIGITYGWLTVKTKRLAPSIFAHGLHNTVAAILLVSYLGYLP